MSIVGTFDKWDAALTFTSPDVSTGVLFLKIQADSVGTGSGMKNGKLKGKNLLNVKENPVITFKSTKIEQTGPEIFSVDGDFTIRGVTRPRKTEPDCFRQRDWLRHDCRDHGLRPQGDGMNSGIPLIRITDRVQSQGRTHQRASTRP